MRITNGNKVGLEKAATAEFLLLLQVVFEHLRRHRLNYLPIMAMPRPTTRRQKMITIHRARQVGITLQLPPPLPTTTTYHALKLLPQTCTIMRHPIIRRQMSKRRQ